MDLRDIPDDDGAFDYIIVHGLYSWVPPEVRAHVMPLIARLLAPNGIALVSYNTFPGCRIRQATRDMLRFHTRDCPDLTTKLAAARALITLIANSNVNVTGGDATMRDDCRRLARRTDGALCHDDLNDTNDPVYFHEFVADAARCGLTFVVETDLFSMTAGDAGPNVLVALEQMDRLTCEQYLDFLKFRPFRSSLICHAEALPDFNVFPEKIAGMHVAPSQGMRGLIGSGKTMRYQDDDARALMEFLLARFPQSVAVVDLAAWHSARKPPKAYRLSRPLRWNRSS